MSVYRIAGLPTSITKHDATSVLCEFFGSDAGITIRSLGLHPQRPSTVAIAMFANVPSALQGASPWKFEKALSHAGQKRHVRLEVDTAFLGFTPVSAFADTEEGGIDCIVVSGLSSHPFGSWKARGGQFMWLVDDPSVYPTNARVLLYGYDTKLVGSSSFRDITDIGEQLAISIKSIRKPPHSRAAIVFIAHSLGGLVVKEAVCHMDTANVRCVYGFVFFGVPHQGLHVEPWLRIVQNQANKVLIESLGPGARVLQRLGDRFRSAIASLDSRAISIFETMQSATTKEKASGVVDRSGESTMLVTVSSALGNWPDSVVNTQIPVNRHHEDLPKFRGNFDEDYLLLMDQLQDLWRRAGTVVQRRCGMAEKDAPESNTETEEEAEAIGPPVLGLVPLWPRPEMEEDNKIETSMDLIAIHGLAGHALRTWTEGSKLWLRDFLPWDLPKIRVLTFGYDTASTSSIRDYSLQLLQSIRRLRRQYSGEAARKIIFVCHGLGGVVLKKAVALTHENRRQYGGIEESFLGAIFLGTPHGQDARFWSEYLFKAAQVYKLSHDAFTSFSAQSTEIGTVCSQFVNLGRHLQIFSLYEQKPTEPLATCVVEESSAILHQPNETCLALDEDHRGICKFLTKSSASYLTVHNCIAELFDTLSTNLEKTYFNSSEQDFLSKLSEDGNTQVLNQISSHWGKTTAWLLEDAEFQSWTQLHGQQVLWLYGPPGSGKTVLMRSVMMHLMDRVEEVDSSVIFKPLYFFFDDKGLTRKSSLAFVRSILCQILSDSRTAFAIKYLDDHDQLGREAEKEDSLWQYLSTMVRRSRGIVFQFVVDAVDEVLRNTSDASDTIIDRLEHLTSLNSSGRVRIMISMREKPSYEFSDVNLVVIGVDNGSTKQNVNAYIRYHAQKVRAKHYLSSDVAAEIEARIVQVSRGNFLYARLALEQFQTGAKQWSREQIHASLSRLDKASRGFVAAYCRLLRGIPKTHRAKAKASFAIIRVSQGKLTSRELAFLATLYEASLTRKPLRLDTIKLQSSDFESYLSSACGYILTKSTDGTVNFAHVSAKDLFLADTHGLDPDEQKILQDFFVSDADAHALLLMLCISVMELEERDDASWKRFLSRVILAKFTTDVPFQRPGKLKSDEEIRATIDAATSAIRSGSKAPCLLYALQYWTAHYEKATPSLENDQKMASFFTTYAAAVCHILWTRTQFNLNNAHLATYAQVHVPDIESSLVRRQDIASATAALFRTLARGDHPRIIKALLANGADVNFSEDSITPLSWSIICRKRESFRLFLRHEAVAVNYGIPRRFKAIHYAARCQDPFFIRQLLQDPYINIRNLSHEGSALHVAVSGKNIAAVHALLDHPDVDITTANEKGVVPYKVVYQDKVWGSVLEKMASMAPETILAAKLYETSPLLSAGVHGWTHVEETILRLYPQQILEVDSYLQMNVLSFYAFFGRREKLLWILHRLPRDMKLRYPDEKYDLLHLCAHQNWEDIVHRLMRDYHLASLPRDHTGRTLLHWAIEHGWNMRRLDLGDYSLEQLNTQDDDGCTAVHLAVENRNMAALERLVASGASYMTRNKKGMSPVHLAAEQGYRAAVDFFVEMPECEFGRTNTGASLLHLLSLWFDETLVRRLVRFKRARLDTVDKQRRTALHYAAMVNNGSVAAQLVKLGARMEARDTSGMTPLLEALRSGSMETAECLLRLGANSRSVDAFGQSPLHLSLRYGHHDLVDRFLAIQADINAKDRFGMTALHRACSNGRAEHVYKLYDFGAAWNPKNVYGRSPIDLAVEQQNMETVKAMLVCLKREKVSERRVRRRLRSALTLAYEFGYFKAKHLLVEAGAEVDRRTIRVRQLYMTEPTPEPGRWALILREQRIRGVKRYKKR